MLRCVLINARCKLNSVVFHCTFAIGVQNGFIHTFIEHGLCKAVFRPEQITPLPKATQRTHITVMEGRL